MWPKYFLLFEIIQRQTRNLGTQRAGHEKEMQAEKKPIFTILKLFLNFPFVSREHHKAPALLSEVTEKSL